MTVAIKKHNNKKTREIGSTDQFVLMLHSEYEAKIHIILMAIIIYYSFLYRPKTAFTYECSNTEEQTIQIQPMVPIMYRF